MVYFGAPRDEVAIKSQRPVIEKGLGALKQLAVFEPFIAGKEYSYADIAAYFHLQFTNLHTTKLYDWDIYKEDQALAEYIERRMSAGDVVLFYQASSLHDAETSSHLFRLSSTRGRKTVLSLGPCRSTREALSNRG